MYHLRDSQYHTAIFLAGPDTHKDYNFVYDYLEQNFNSIVTIGDGRENLLNGTQGILTKSLESLGTYLPNEPNQKVMLFVYVHGNIYDQNHVLVFEDDTGLYTSSFFSLLNQHINQPMDIIFLPCHGKAAIKDVSSLPKESNILIFSDEDKSTYFSNIEILLKSDFKDKLFTLDKFYDNYLNLLQKTNENPIIVNVQEQITIIDPLLLADKYIGKSISEDSRKFIHQNLSNNICNDKNCHKELDLVMDKIQNTTSFGSFKETSSENYSNFWEIYSLLKQEYLFARNSHHLEITPYNYQDIQFCSSEIIPLKEKIDSLLNYHNIPLTLNLSSNPWHKYDDDYDIEELDIFDIDYLVYKILLNDEEFQETYSFPAPEPADYGKVLLIAKYMEQIVD